MGRAAVATRPRRKPARPDDPGERAVRFINNLTHIKGEWAGKPFNLRPWQEQIIRRLFGTLRPDGRRQYRTCYVEIPRKNGKTELAAAIGLLLLIGDREAAAEVYSAAVDREQASLVFHAAGEMVRGDKVLSEVCRVIDSRRHIAHFPSGSFYKAIPAESAGRHGYDAHGIIYDEIHAAPNRELYDVLTTSTGARRQPLIFIITTAGYDRNSICWELHDYAEKVRDGIIEDPTFLPVLYGAPMDADWLDEDVWRAANPALDDFRSLEEMREFAARAAEVPGLQNVFRRLYLCQWTESESRWLDMELWRACDGSVDANALRGRACFAGLDLASTKDICALTLVFPPEQEGEPVQILAHFWVPEEGVLERARRDRVPYDVWVRDGYITATPGNSTDYDVIRRDVNTFAAVYNIRELAIDRWNSTQLQTQLMGDGIDVVQFGQGFASMTAPTKEVERLVRQGGIRHGGNPVLTWMAANVMVEQDAAGNLKPSKGKSTERIDGIVALVMGVGRAMVSEGDGRSVYESKESLAL